MLPDASEFVSLLARARRGDDDAVRILYDSCAPPLLGAIRHHLNRRLHGLCEPEDILQSVWLLVMEKSLLQRHFAGPTPFLAFFLRVARRQVHRLHRRHLECDKRDRRRVQSLSSTHGPAGNVADPNQSQPVASLQAAESLQATLQRIPHACDICAMRSKGGSLQEIAETLGLTERRVQQIVHDLCHLLAI